MQTESPARLAWIAAAQPAGPAPKTSRSTFDTTPPPRHSTTDRTRDAARPSRRAPIQRGSDACGAAYDETVGLAARASSDRPRRRSMLRRDTPDLAARD